MSDRPRTLTLALVMTVACLFHALPGAAQTPPEAAKPKWSIKEKCQLKTLENRPSPFGLGVYFEQDDVLPWLNPWSDDRNYTMGLAFPMMGQWIHRAKLDLALRGMDCLTGLNKAHNDQVTNSGEDSIQDFSLVFGHTAFTPHRIELTAPIPGDRPYASLLFLSAARTTVNPHERRVLRSELTLGVLGLRIGHGVQTWIHRKRRAGNGPGALTPYDPRGWPHQISDGGEPTAKYTVSLGKAASESPWHDLSLHGEASVGYYTNVAAGALVRVGHLRSPFWALNSTPLNVGNQVVRKPLDEQLQVDYVRSQRRFELAGFAAGRMRLVGHNALLQGQFKHSDVTMNAGQISRVVLEGEIGATVGVGKCALVLTLARRTAEFIVGALRPHTFGGVHLVCAGRRRDDGNSSPKNP